MIDLFEGPFLSGSQQEVLELSSDLAGQGGTGRCGSCSTEYVRGREAVRLGVHWVAGIANCNLSVILLLGMLGRGFYSLIGDSNA